MNYKSGFYILLTFSFLTIGTLCLGYFVKSVDNEFHRNKMLVQQFVNKQQSKIGLTKNELKNLYQNIECTSRFCIVHASEIELDPHFQRNNFINHDFYGVDFQLNASGIVINVSTYKP